MVPVSTTVQEIGRISALLAELQEDGNGAQQEPGRPFDIREYEVTVREVGTAVTEIRALLADFDEVLASGRLKAVVKTVDETEDEVGELVGRVKLAAVQVLALFFVLLLAYRWLSSRIGRARA
jgi:hypothetical protein